eukprot:TRINITY_DN4745_c0_g1_i2.p1 TRINITY_DN4745_c0_g1~~TRINITY_DN4745_c0_g1_i2.p1  ORF type:complete len:322 (-),score=49.10 TRINITY_DN4745_c0_g1_i2:109-930(-)
MAFALGTWHSLVAALQEGMDGYLQRVAAWIAFFVAVHYASVLAAKRSPLLASRVTVVGATFHGCLTGWLAVAICCGFVDISWWPSLGLPVSLAYLCTDIMFYCIPKLDFAITGHHLVMIFCHLTSGTRAGAEIAGAGDYMWSQQLSVAGYLSELANPFLNTRWYLLKVLNHHHPIYTLNSIVLLLTWIGGRIVVLSMLVLFRILPRFNDFAERGIYDCFFVCVAGHLLILAMSLDWMMKFFRGGFVNFFIFNPDGSSNFNPNFNGKEGGKKAS